MRWALTAILGMLVAGESRADIGPTLPVAHYAHPTHLIETREAHPDHVFVVEHSTLTFGASHTFAFVDFAPGQPIVLSTEYRGSVTLLIVPRSAAARYATAEAVAKAVHAGDITGVVKRGFGYRETVPTWRGNEITITYRLQRSNGGDGWELVRTSWNPMLSWYVAAGLLTVGIVLGGIWLLRRKRRRGKPTPEPAGHGMLS